MKSEWKLAEEQVEELAMTTVGTNVMEYSGRLEVGCQRNASYLSKQSTHASTSLQGVLIYHSWNERVENQYPIRNREEPAAW
jgi:hypothetical protein